MCLPPRVGQGGRSARRRLDAGEAARDRGPGAGSLRACGGAGDRRGAASAWQGNRYLARPEYQPGGPVPCHGSGGGGIHRAVAGGFAGFQAMGMGGNAGGAEQSDLAGGRAGRSGGRRQAVVGGAGVLSISLFARGEGCVCRGGIPVAMNSFDASPILLSLRLALVSTGLLLVIGVPLGYWLAGPFSMRRAAVEFITCLPLVLPPTVVGFYLLWALRPGWWPARIFER